MDPLSSAPSLSSSSSFSSSASAFTHTYSLRSSSPSPSPSCLSSFDASGISRSISAKDPSSLAPPPLQSTPDMKESETATLNQENLRMRRKKKKFVGVRQRPSGRWVAEIKDTTQKIRLWLGTFDTAEEAARAYDEAACLLRGSNTRTNFSTHNPPAPASPLASKLAHLLHVRRKNSANFPAQPRILEPLTSNSETDDDPSVLPLPPPSSKSSVNPIQPAFCKITEPTPQLSSEHKSTDRGQKAQHSCIGSDSFQNGSYLDAVLGLNDDMLGSNDVGLTSAIDSFYYSPFYFADESMATSIQLHDFPLVSEFSRHLTDEKPSYVEEGPGNNQGKRVSNEIITKHVSSEKSISASFYGENRATGCQAQSNTAPYNFNSSAGFQLQASFYNNSSSFRSNGDLSCITSQATAPATTPGSNFSTTENMDPDQNQEAMWNSWDLPPLCPLSVA